MKHGSLFSGIGGFDLAAKWMGWDNVFHCALAEFQQKVLKHHFPESISYEDITKTDFSIHAGAIDIITGGFPCQPFSLAGARKGTADDRHLWPAMLDVIRTIKPRWVVGENVYGIVNWSDGLVFEQVQADLENEGYEVQPYILPAASLNAPHKIDRLWFVAYCDSYGQHQCDSEHEKHTGEGGQYAQCDVSEGIDNGALANTTSKFSKWRKQSLIALGNAIVPQVALQIFKTIEAFEEQIKK